jgi:hypothetical protein
MDENSKGGNDHLRVEGESSYRQYLVGDAYEMRGHARGGNDRLETGPGNDDLWGDAVVKDAKVITGSDTFVFGPNTGNDTIHDFESGKDRIDLTSFASLGIHSLQDLDWEVISGDTHLQLADNTSITLVGVSAVTQRDFFWA